MTSPRAFALNMGEMTAPSSSTTSSAVHSLTSASTLDSPTESSARRALRDSVFESATWREPDAETPEELQRKDPLGTQIWKLYSKTRNTLPNSERMENLTWRMMSMNLRRAQHQRYAPLLPTPTHQRRSNKEANDSDAAATAA
jgi:GATA-binding protein